VFLSAISVLGRCSLANSQSSATGVSPATLSKRITVEGRAVNHKMGAQLVGSDSGVWIDGLHSWLEGFYSSREKGMEVAVSKILTEDNGLPVFIRNAHEPPVQGIPGRELGRKLICKT